MNLQNLLGRLTGGNPQVCDRYRCELEAVYRRVAEGLSARSVWEIAHFGNLPIFRCSLPRHSSAASRRRIRDNVCLVCLITSFWRCLDLAQAVPLPYTGKCHGMQICTGAAETDLDEIKLVRGSGTLPTCYVIFMAERIRSAASRNLVHTFSRSHRLHNISCINILCRKNHFFNMWGDMGVYGPVSPSAQGPPYQLKNLPFEPHRIWSKSDQA